MRLSSCISLDLLYIHNGDEPSENSHMPRPNHSSTEHKCIPVLFQLPTYLDTFLQI